MAIVKWDPLEELKKMQQEMNRLFDRSQSRLYGESLEDGLWQPAADIFEDEEEVVVMMEVPEVDQEDIDVRVEDGMLIIEGERKLERDEKRQNYHRIERSYGTFRRAFALPVSVVREEIRATCDRGVLKVALPKRRPEDRREIEGRAG